MQTRALSELDNAVGALGWRIYQETHYAVLNLDLDSAYVSTYVKFSLPHGFDDSKSKSLSDGFFMTTLVGA